jgi:hypothetical protein
MQIRVTRLLLVWQECPKKIYKLLFNQNKKVISILSRSRVGLREREKISKIPQKWFQFQITQHSFSDDISWAAFFHGTPLVHNNILFNSFYGTARAIIQIEDFSSSSLVCVHATRRIMDSWTAKKKRGERHKKKNDNFVAFQLYLLSHIHKPTEWDFMWFYREICRLMCW